MGSAAAAAREAAATKWLDSWREHQAGSGPPPSNVNLIEVTKVVAKTAVKQEVAHFLEVQLLPMVRTQLRERIVPALVKELREMAVQLFSKRFVTLGLALLFGTSAFMAITLGPWVAVFVLLR